VSVALDIVRTYRAPREILRRRVADGPREDRAIAILMAACVVMFIAQWPYLARLAHQDPTIPLEARLGGALLGWVFMVPLVLYALSAIVHVLARAAGGQASWFEARMALFWALLASTPLWLLNGLVLGFVGPGIEARGTGLLALAALFIFWISGLREVEGARKAVE
jgi:hypothetical protein